MAAYYNEIDPFASEWLKELMKEDVIADGEIDNRSIEDVTPSDLAGFTQCHFFAGIGVWSYALRQAGWPDDRPVWTGSCPCQPFSAAGKGNGFADERHLWPAFHWLIEQCRPVTVFGEQVASKDGLAWLDLVQTDMEGAGYAFGAVDTCSAGFGAPHIRQRLYWVGSDTLGDTALWGCVRGEVGNEAATQCQTLGSGENEGCGRHDTANDGACLRLAHAEIAGRTDGEEISGSSRQVSCAGKPLLGVGDCSTDCERPGPTNGFWRDADWLGCRDAKWRPVRPGSFPLADGLPGRVGRLRAYGNAIVPQLAATFILATEST